MLYYIVLRIIINMALVGY